MRPRFYSVAETAQILGVSDMTVYRAIRCKQFPAVQVMGRLIIPARVLDEMADAAIDRETLVDAREWASSSSQAHA